MKYLVALGVQFLQAKQMLDFCALFASFISVDVQMSIFGQWKLSPGWSLSPFDAATVVFPDIPDISWSSYTFSTLDLETHFSKSLWFIL